MLRKIFLALGFFFFFFLSAAMFKNEALAAKWPGCKIENPPALNTDSVQTPSGIIIDTGGNAAVGAEYKVSFDRLDDPNGRRRIHDKGINYISFTAEKTPDNKIIININQAFGGTGSTDLSTNVYFKDGTYEFNIWKDWDQPLCETNTNLQFKVLKASDDTSKYCKVILAPDSLDGKVYPDTVLTMSINFKDEFPDARGSDSTGHTVRVIDGSNNIVHNWGYPTFCGGPGWDNCTGYITTKLESGVNISVKEDKSAFQGYSTGKGYNVVIDDNSCSKKFDSNSHAGGGGDISGTCKFCPIGTYQGLTDPTNPGSDPICKRDNQDVKFSTCDLVTDKDGHLQQCSPIYGCQIFTGINDDPGNPPIRSDVCPKGNDSNGNPYNNGETCTAIPSGLGVDLFTNMPGFMQALLGVILSVIGGIAILLIIISGYRLMVAQGNPEKIQAAKEELTAAIVGFLFVIFSLVIIQVIGYDILQLPGFGQ